MMVFVAAISVYTLHLLIICGKRLDCEDYEKLVSKVCTTRDFRLNIYTTIDI